MGEWSTTFIKEYFSDFCMSEYVHRLRKKGRSFRFLPLLLAVYFLLATTILPLASAGYVKDEGTSTQEVDDVFIRQIGGPDMPSGEFEKFDNLVIKVNLTFGSAVDVYLMACSEYDEHYRENLSFKTIRSRQNVTGNVTIKWQKDDEKIYCMVVDNKDNAREDDAVPEGRVGFQYYLETDNNSHKRHLWVITMVGVVVGAAILGALAVYIMVKRRDW